MRSLGAAIAFLTRIPMPSAALYGAVDVGKAARWFPLVGVLLGGVYAGMLHVLSPVLPALVVAVLIVATEALLTGALHMDALADTADGFGGGRSREEILRIMRDHAIGSYGATALILLAALKITTIGALAGRPHATAYLILAPALGRWSILPLSRLLSYARETPGAVNHVGTLELVWGSILAAGAAALPGFWSGVVCWALVAALTACFGRFCFRRIGGITGDTLGANVEISACAVLLAGLILG